MSPRLCSLSYEFITPDYFGSLPGDPDGGRTRVVTQNRVGATFWVGKQSNGGPFTPYWDRIGAVGHYDYGSLTMARTLGGTPNQVRSTAVRGEIGWGGGSHTRHI